MHSVKKPGCAKAVLRYFEGALARKGDVKGKGRAINDSYPSGPVVDIRDDEGQASRAGVSSDSPEQPSGEGTRYVLVIGDRVMTDVVLANTMQQLRGRRLWWPFRSKAAEEAAKAAMSPVSAIPVLTTTVWKMEGLGSRIMRALEGWSMRCAMWYSVWQHGHEPLYSWRECIKARPVPVPVQDAEVAASVARARSMPQQTIRDRLWVIFGRVGRGLTRPIRRRWKSARGALDIFAQEARQGNYGFRLPDGLGRVQVMGRLLQSDVARSGVGQKVMK